MVVHPDWREKAASKLSSVTGLKVQDFSHCDFGRDRNPTCISVLVEEKKGLNPFPTLVGRIEGIFGNPRAQKQAIDFLHELRPQLDPDLVAFIGTTRWLGEFKPNGVELVIGEGKCQEDILRLAKVDAINYDMDTEALVKKLQHYDAQIGIDIIQAETDTVWFELKNLPEDLPAFAADLYEFCPDLVDQGCGDLHGLIAELKKDRRVCLWWD